MWVEGESVSAVFFLHDRHKRMQTLQLFKYMYKISKPTMRDFEIGIINFFATEPDD